MMWMMGYNDGGEFNNNIQDPFNGRKLRPLMPRPAAASASASTHPPSAMAEQNKREVSRQQVVVSSRWNPTPEQLQTLEELYRRGTRTPSADQIQHITSQLRRYGKIEGKNVFYWFQNHKARERQKRRRRLESLSDEQLNQNSYTGNGEKIRESAGPNRTVHEVEQTKNWASPTNSSTVAAEKTLSTTPGAAKAGEAESKADGWAELADEEELQDRRNATWQMMHLSSSSSSTLLTNLINPPSSAATVTSTINQSTLIRMETNPHNFINIYNADHSSNGDAQTLQLFPLQSSTCRQRLRDENTDGEDESGAAMCGDSITPYQFFEFLPLKN
ncbi:hypothetical protein BUALT_Bualt02G0082800 [Buddleja alternifolia]|uniref:Homeobox domain-containing protein n=1 Tax=Buddleja alternifolia TaxID=168488 RepID=A0AAV6Y9A6_9LAMI|nr:hypothetical protein BUALT_Bualt02G0082800 [Buddleja alternifolia]